jgi:hypothetical protein
VFLPSGLAKIFGDDNKAGQPANYTLAGRNKPPQGAAGRLGFTRQILTTRPPRVVHAIGLNPSALPRLARLPYDALIMSFRQHRPAKSGGLHGTLLDNSCDDRRDRNFDRGTRLCG